MLAYVNIFFSLNNMGEWQRKNPELYFSELASVFSNLVKTEVGTEALADGTIDVYTEYVGGFRGLELTPGLRFTSYLGLGDKVNGQVRGDSKHGIAMVVRSRNPFARYRHGFYFQPDELDGSFAVIHGPARKPGKSDWAASQLLDPELARPLVDNLVPELIDAIGNLEYRKRHLHRHA